VSDIWFAEKVLRILDERKQALEEHICYGVCKKDDYLGAKASLSEVNSIRENVKEALKKIQYEDDDD